MRFLVIKSALENIISYIKFRRTTKMDEQKEMKKTKTGSGVNALIVIMLVLTLGLSCFSVFNQMNVKAEVKEIYDATVKTTDRNQEDDIEIMGEYTIRSTLPISDAYKSGDTSALDDTQKETLDMAEKVLKEITNDKMTPYEKEEAVYKWLTTEMKADTGLLTVIHQSSDDVDNPHGVLKYRNAVCVGYATTFRLFMQMLDIECKVIHSSDLIHSWDLVKLDDEWYHVDCYSDADSGNYQNFNMDDTLAENNHDWTHDFFPAATGLKYSYASQHSVEIENIFALPEWFKSVLDSGDASACCTFKEKIKTEDDEKVAKAMVNAIKNRLEVSEDYSEYFIEPVWTLNQDQDYVLMITIENYNEDDDEIELDKKTQKKLDKALDEVFGAGFTDFGGEEDEGKYAEEVTTAYYG